MLLHSWPDSTFPTAIKIVVSLFGAPHTERKQTRAVCVRILGAPAVKSQQHSAMQIGQITLKIKTENSRPPRRHHS